MLFFKKKKKVDLKNRYLAIRAIDKGETLPPELNLELSKNKKRRAVAK